MKRQIRYIYIVGIVLVLMLSGIKAFAYVASSTNYLIARDSINIGGGLGTSSSYSLENTIGEVATGYGSSTAYNVHAGYQQVEAAGISITSPADVTLTPSINTRSGGQADGSAVWTVNTDSRTGYSLAIKVSTNPALQSGGNSFANYTPAGANPDYTWSVGSSAKEFGFTPEGTDIHSRYNDNGSLCNTGSGNTSLACWDPLTTADRTIATRSTANNPSGTATTVRFRAEAGSSSAPVVGTYQSGVTVTAVAI